MGNSQSSKKSKKKTKKYESDSEDGEEEVEYEEVEVSVYETVHDESSPKSPPKRQLEPPINKSQYRRNEPRPYIPSYEEMRKPIKNATMFARHYAMTLHRLEIGIGFPQESYWIDNLESLKDDNILGISQQSPWATMIEDRDYKNGQVPQKNVPVNTMNERPNLSYKDDRGSPLFKPVSTSGMSYQPGSQRAMPDLNRISLGRTDGLHKSTYGQDIPAPQTQNSTQNHQGSNLPRPEQSRQPELNQSTTHHDNGQGRHHHSVRMVEKVSDEEKDGRHVYHKERRFEEIDEVVEEDEPQEDEHSYIKTTFRQSEPNSETQDYRKYGYDRRGCVCEETNCVECLNRARGGINGRGREGELNAMRDSLNRRDLKLSIDKEAMLENYLEKVVANKPSRVQKLLVEQYMRPRSNERHTGSIHNRISDTLRNRMRSQSREYEEDQGRGSYIVQNLEEQLSTNLRNPEPVLLQKNGVKFIDDGSRMKKPLKLVKFVKEINLYDKGSINYGVANSNYDNKNIAYLTDKYQLKNYIEKQKENKRGNGKKSYTNLKTDQLWPKGTKFDRASVTKQIEKNEFNRLSREAESVKHSMNYTAVKHHPRNLNLNQDTLRPSSPKWGSPRESHKMKPPAFSPITSTIPKRVQQTKTLYSEKEVSSYQEGDKLGSSSMSHIRNRKDLIRQAIENSDTY